MAKKDKSNNRKRNTTINKLANSVQSNINKIYRNTYFTKSNNYSDLEDIKSNIDSSIDNIISNNINSVGIPNISKLYSRIQMKDGGSSNDEKLIGEIENLFSDPSISDGILSYYTQNKYIKDLDEEIDLICRYMPQLEDALDSKKDNVLSADHFSKDFISIENRSNLENDEAFNQRVIEFKNIYNLLELFEEAYDSASHYGEQFIYIVPYKKALTKLNNARNGDYSGAIITNEAVSISENGKISMSIDIENNKIITEGSSIIDKINDNPVDVEMGKLNVELGMAGVLESALDSYSAIDNVFKRKSNKNNNSGFEGSSAVEGIIAKDTKSKDRTKIDVPGCIIKKLKRENVVPIYIDEICLGYYYFEYDNDIFNTNSISDPMMAIKSNKLTTDQYNVNRDTMMKSISGKLSGFIDSKFINANQDLRKEIYMILKHNDLFNVTSENQLKVTFIPPEDMHHIYFKKDENTHRGISDLYKSLLPAKLYTSLYVTNTLGVLTRGQDKRVYYVKQNIDSNISQTLLNTINQIKKSNFGARELSSVKNILNITGRYNDYVIPVGPTGDSPIQFEIMQGQNIETKTELMNMLEQMAINGTDVPYEHVQARQSVDYAVRLTMSNGKFLRKTFKRQALLQKIFSRIVTAIYNAEYDTDEELLVILPPPAFLNTANTNQMIQNTAEYVEAIVEMEMPNEEDDVKLVFKQKMKRHQLRTYLDMQTISKLKNEAVLEVNSKKVKDEE